MINAGRGPMTRDHGEDPLVAWQHVHRHNAGAAGLSGRDQRADQGGSDPVALPRVGHDDADLRNRGAAGAGPVRCDPVPDDGTVSGRDHGVGTTAPGQDAEQGWGDCQRGEESEVPGPRGQVGEEGPECFPVRRASPPDRDSSAGDRIAILGSVHRLSLPHHS